MGAAPLEKNQQLATRLHALSLAKAELAWQELSRIPTLADPEAQAAAFTQVMEALQASWELESPARQLAPGYFQDATQERTFWQQADDPHAFFLEAYQHHRRMERKLKRLAPSSSVPDALSPLQQAELIHLNAMEAEWKQRWTTPFARSKQRIAIALNRAYDGWIKLGKNMGTVTMTLMLGLIYGIGGLALKRYLLKNLRSEELEEDLQDRLMEELPTDKNHAL
ncbi:MAG: hypothetical protein AAFR61_16530 [Bacteroidota bacterium]